MSKPWFAQQLNAQGGHVMMMVQFLLDTDREVSIPGSPQPVSRFIDLVEPVAPAFQQEKRVTAQIHELTRIAREENDFAADQCMQWFIKEQVEGAPR